MLHTMPEGSRARSLYAVYAFAVCAALVGAQAHAFGSQWQLGFRPFGTAPQRVPLSWDMFSVEIERCGVDWQPPLRWDDKIIHRLSDLGAPVEWDLVFNRREDYRAAAAYACGQRALPDVAGRRRFELHCFAPRRDETREELACPP
jgi:hypothetical protein